MVLFLLLHFGISSQIAIFATAVWAHMTYPNQVLVINQDQSKESVMEGRSLIASLLSRKKCATKRNSKIRIHNHLKPFGYEGGITLKFIHRTVSCFLGVCMLLCSSLSPALAKNEEDKSEMYESLPHIQAYLNKKKPQKITRTNFGKENARTFNECFKRLKELGYIVAGNAQYEWRSGFEKNIYLFAQQMELGKEHEKELTPLVQALLLAGDDAKPIIVQGVINAE